MIQKRIKIRVRVLRYMADKHLHTIRSNTNANESLVTQLSSMRKVLHIQRSQYELSPPGGTSTPAPAARCTDRSGNTPRNRPAKAQTDDLCLDAQH